MSKTLRPYLVVFTASLFFLFEFINMNSFDALNDQLRQAFQVDALAISNLSAMYFYANVIFLIPAGLLLDRFSTRKLLLWATFICIISNLVFASSKSFEIAQLCRFITGVGSTLALLSAALLTSRWIEPRHAGIVMGGVVTLAMLGGMLAQQITWVLHFTGSWRLAIMLVSVLGAVFWICIFTIVRDYPPSYEQTQQKSLQIMRHHFWTNFWLALKNKQVWFSGTYTSLINLTVMVIGALWGKDYLMVVHQFTALQASSAISMVFLGLMLGSPLFGAISDGLGRRKLVMIVGGVLNLICILVILYNPITPLLGNLLFFALGVISGSQIITYPLIMESVPAYITASSESISAALIMGGGAVFQPLFGWLLDHFSAVPGQYDASAFSKAIWILPIAFIVATIFSLFLKETYCKTQAHD